MYYAIYKCRLCKERFENQGTSTKDVAFDVTMRTALGLKHKDPMNPCMTEVHLCKDGSFGIADFLGMKYMNDTNRKENINVKSKVLENRECCTHESTRAGR